MPLPHEVFVGAHLILIAHSSGWRDTGRHLRSSIMPVTTEQLSSYNRTVERLREYEGDEARFDAGVTTVPGQHKSRLPVTQRESDEWQLGTKV